ncbi:alpha/beta fold hydrolase [Phaeobacter sp. PT47_59]|uniref:PHA/PHB synthase family protein n=1 Tax=Phaeobacter sp. PT47_59 TaxID=3029979 RepID=UPI0023809490|nr:alpha/beta fold hydrolase [Phaeobacter sp. PT47_59]MDE4173856.1 alpha/beta fold hydrolase [Phaeobacter sp. PT47_59]
MRDLKDTPRGDKAEADSSSDDQARILRKELARLTRGASPVSTVNMISDWALHLALAPDKKLSLALKAQENWLKWMGMGAQETAQEAHAPSQRPDRRFAGEAWSKQPYSSIAQGFLLAEEFADQATSNVPGLSPSHERAMTFLMRQMMDTVAPSNFLFTNPEAMARTAQEHGSNLMRGGAALFRDWQATLAGEKPQPQLRVGQDLATSKGKVVYRNHLMELIQYEAVTETVQAEPILIVPAWIMKYYILDLSPENSMVRYLTEQGFTVFMISWRNPGAEDAALGMADYLQQGPMAALDHICAATGAGKVHTVGYCLGGTLLSIAAAAMARDGDDRLHSMTLLAAQTDFSEAGELMLFINESQVSFLEDVMEAQGYLDSGQMMSAFQMLRSNDLIWSHMIRSYLMGEDDLPMNDLMAWNMDTTRMPARMHSEYLRKMFLNNDLAAGRYHVDGHAVSLRDIRVPVFTVGTETDHIAPWKSVFKIHNLGHADVTFVLTNGGHNAGVVSEPGHKRRHFRLHTVRDQDKALPPEDWLEVAGRHEGSWWPAWADWLAARSSGKTAARVITAALEAAPGSYVRMD